jgi:hypothetical protein
LTIVLITGAGVVNNVSMRVEKSWGGCYDYFRNI